MAAVNLHMLPANGPFDFLPNHHPHAHAHSRSNSVSSSSSHSPHSRPQSSQGAILRTPALIPASAEDLYRASFHTTGFHPDHTRIPSDASAYSLASTELITPADSPPNHNITNPALKNHLRHSHIRARVAVSPYPRDADVHSSSSETEDLTMYLGPTATDYNNAMFADPQMLGGISPETINPMGAYNNRMSMNPDHALEKLAANVRAATTTSASDRAKQIFVQAWLTANYAPYPDGNVPRQGLYFSYRRVCDQYGIPHINTATLGKAIRLCFPSIKTRRLGVRGNSKYHYCGIRPATSAEAEFLQDYIRKSNNNAAQQSVNAARIASEQAEATGRGEERSDEDDEDDSDAQSSGNASKRNSLNLGNGIKNVVDFPDEKTPTAATLLSQAQGTQRPTSASFPPQASIRRHTQPPEGPLAVSQHPSPSGENKASLPFMPTSGSLSVRQMVHFPSIEEALGANSTSPHAVLAREVWGWFQDHLDSLLDGIRGFRFDQFEVHIRSFWSTLSPQHREVIHAPIVAGLMAKADAIVYDEILEFLRSQMLSPIPPVSIAGLRNLADKMEKILLVSLEGYGTTFVEPKVELGARFGHLVLRFLDMYQVTQALSTVLTNPKQLADMRRSWQKVDFESVRNQSALVCNCRHEDLLQLLEVEFVSLLDGLVKSSEPVRDVMSWADKCCDRLMANRGGEDRATMSSRSVLIRWGYVTSQVMRDLTIRSDPTFGAFQILKLFLDDWISLNVLRSVALSTNSVAASVEPMMQSQYLTLSPMPGQESFPNPLDVRPHHGMAANTPTTSSMLAALQHEPFPATSLESASFTPDAFSSLSYMDATSQDGSLPVNNSELGFPDYVSGSSTFDMSSFTPQDLGISAEATPPPSGSEPDTDSESSNLKTES